MPTIRKGLLVPKGKTYARLDAKGQVTAIYASGQRMEKTDGDCVKVKCPKSFKKSIVCWDCRKTKTEPIEL